MHRRGETADSAEVRRSHAVPEVVALAVTGLAFVVTLLV
jgi:hypothetical protein